jgi:hypothetical protein
MMSLPPMQNLSERASVAPKAQHEPHCCWSRMGWMQVENFSVLGSKLAGVAPKV